MVPDDEVDGQAANEPLHTPDGHRIGDVLGHVRAVGHAAKLEAHVKSGQRTVVPGHTAAGVH